MKISPASTSSGTSLHHRRLEQNRNVQNVFSQVLNEAGRQGYASADGIETDVSVESQIQSSWEQWYGVELEARYKHAENPIELGQQYGDLVLRAYQEGGYVQPKEFLASLSADELGVVQRTNWLASPIQVNELTEEGALNLLLPSAAQIDLNRDGLTQSGKAYGIRFPDSTTPLDVVRAWEESTADLSEFDRSFYQLQMKLPVLMANFYVDENGAYSHHFEPGDPEWINPMASPDYSYAKAVRDQIASLKAFESQIDPVRFAKDVAFWSNFQDRLAAAK